MPVTSERTRLSYIADTVRRYDRDRFLTALFAPQDRREDLMALYAFNLEIAKTREAVSEPVIGLMRLQWWRDALEEIYETGRPRHHAVAEALAAAIAGRALDRTELESLIDARERDLEDTAFTSVAALETYAEATTAPLFRLGLAVLGVSGTQADQAVGHMATGYALCGLMRALPHFLRSRRTVIPDDLIAEHHVDKRALMAFRPSDGLAAAVEALSQRARRHLEEGRRSWPGSPRTAMPVLLNGRVAGHHLARLRHAGYNPFDPRLAGGTGMLAATLWLRATFGRL